MSSVSPDKRSDISRSPTRYIKDEMEGLSSYGKEGDILDSYFR